MALFLVILVTILLVHEIYVEGAAFDCECTSEQIKINAALANDDFEAVCGLMDKKMLCFKMLELDPTCAHIKVEEEICKILNDHRYTSSCESNLFNCNSKGITECLTKDLDNIPMKIPDENCPHIIEFLDCARQYVMPEPKKHFDRLTVGARRICGVINESLYTECDKFMDCYTQLFQHNNIVKDVQTPKWWCSQLREVAKCSGLSPSKTECDFVDFTSNTDVCKIPNSKKDENQNTNRGIHLPNRNKTNPPSAEGISANETVALVLGLLSVAFLILLAILVIYKVNPKCGQVTTNSNNVPNLRKYRFDRDLGVTETPYVANGNGSLRYQ